MKDEKRSCEFWEGRIVAFLDRELDTESWTEIEGHIASCADCMQFFAEVEGLYAEADADNRAFAGDISSHVLERAEREALLTEMRAMREEMTALRREVAGLREETARLRNNGRGAETGQSVYLLPYAPPSGGPSLLGMGERGKENKWN